MANEIFTDREQEIASVMQKLDKNKDKGTTSKDKGTYIPKDKRVPYRPEYLKMSKKDVIAAEKIRKENDVKTAVFRKSLESKIDEKVEEKEAEVTESAVEKKAKKKKK